MSVAKKAVKKAVKKPVYAEYSAEDNKWRRLACRLAVELGWSDKDLSKTFGDGRIVKWSTMKDLEKELNGE